MAHSASKSLSLEEPAAFHTSVEATNAALLLIADALHRQTQHYYRVASAPPLSPPTPRGGRANARQSF